MDSAEFSLVQLTSAQFSSVQLSSAQFSSVQLWSGLVCFGVVWSGLAWISIEQFRAVGAVLNNQTYKQDWMDEIGNCTSVRISFFVKNNLFTY